MFKRPQFKELASRISEDRNKLQAMVGPRQVGKSTLVKQVLQETEVPNMMVSADGIPKENTAWIGEVWDTARARMRLGGYREYLLVIDEVHKIDNWSEEVKKQWDADTFNDVNLKVVILGSSRLLLKDGLTESLAGRYELIRMPHWSWKEMHGAFGLNMSQYIYFGGYPGRCTGHSDWICLSISTSADILERPSSSETSPVGAGISRTVSSLRPLNRMY